MQNHERFTIIIPTLDRADTLQHALKTCVMQDYDNLVILVSDNVSVDETKAVVESFDDSRIQYINPGRRLSMSHHWEYALSHVRQGFVSILGDDDGFLPNAVAEAAQLTHQTGLRAIRANYGLYFWPSVQNTTKANTLHISFRSGHSIANGQTELQYVLKGQKDYLTLPSLYNSFVDIRFIKAASQKTGQFFHSRIPDVYSGVALAGLVGNYVYAHRSLKVFGTSGKSNGASLMTNSATNEIAQRFLQEDSLPIHPLAPSTLGRSVGLIIGESFLQSFDAGLNQSLKADFDWRVFIDSARQEILSSTTHHVDEIKKNITEIVQKNSLTNVDSDPLAADSSRTSKWQVLSRVKDIVALVDASTYGVTDIYGACQLYDRIRSNPLQYPGLIPSTLKKITDTAAFATLMRAIGLAR